MFNAADKIVAAMDLMNTKLDKVISLLTIIANLGQQLASGEKSVKMRK